MSGLVGDDVVEIVLGRDDVSTIDGVLQKTAADVEPLVGHGFACGRREVARNDRIVDLAVVDERQQAEVRLEQPVRFVDDLTCDGEWIADRGDSRGDLAKGAFTLGASGHLGTRCREFIDEARVLDR
jgi:hypothetical protein